MRNWRFVLFLISFGVMLATVANNYDALKNYLFPVKNYRPDLAHELGDYIKQNDFVNTAEINWDGDKTKVSITYTFNDMLQKESDKILQKYRPDYAAIVAIDPDTGKILSMASFERNPAQKENLALRASYPAASVFKVVTAAAAVDKKNMEPDHEIQFNGGNHTLYKKNVLSDTVNKWTRAITLKEAFARSINTVFGRIGLKHLDPQDLEEYASRFGFNHKIDTDFPVETSHVSVPTKDDQYYLAEVASGFNKINTMSPVQGAMIAATIAEDGVLRSPYMIEKVSDETGKIIYQAVPDTGAVTLSLMGAKKMQELMEETIQRGTSRKSFRDFVRSRRFSNIEVGGKTGSLHGDNPKGKVDWFVGYARTPERKIAIAALTVNVDKWQVKSAYLAQSLFQKYFDEEYLTSQNSLVYNR